MPNLADVIKVKAPAPNVFGLDIDGDIDCEGKMHSKGEIVTETNLGAKNMVNSGGDMNCEGKMHSKGEIVTETNLGAKNMVNSGGDMNCGGDINVKGMVNAQDVRCDGLDCAEIFAAQERNIEPGTVMVMQDNLVSPCHRAYDKRVIGVMSGAGGYNPGIILGKGDEDDGRIPIALIGRVYCKVDASYASIEAGDLLTTSDTTGHAMKAIDASKAFGTVIGKALSSMSEGQGLIPCMITLQ